MSNLPNVKATENPSGFQRDLMQAIAHLTGRDEDPYGLAIKSVVEERRDEATSTTRVYTNLDALIRGDFIQRCEVDRRTNAYELTDKGTAYLQHVALSIAEDLFELGEARDIELWPRERTSDSDPEGMIDGSPDQNGGEEVTENV